MSYNIRRCSYIEFDHEPTPNELIHVKYTKREKVNGKWRYWYDDKGRTTSTKKYTEYSTDDHKFYNVTERKVETDSVFAPRNKKEVYTDSNGENHKIITDYEGKLERTIQTGANFIARVIKKKAADFAFKRAEKKMVDDLMKNARSAK